MNFSSVGSLLRSFAALPGAGALANLNSMSVLDADEITLWVLYQCNGAVANGAPTLRVRWTMRATAWDPTGGVAEGVIITGGALAVEDFPFVTPGAAGAFWVRLANLKVPAGAQTFDGQVYESGTPATPGNCAVMGVAGQS